MRVQVSMVVVLVLLARGSLHLKRTEEMEGAFDALDGYFQKCTLKSFMNVNFIRGLGMK